MGSEQPTEDPDATLAPTAKSEDSTGNSRVGVLSTRALLAGELPEALAALPLLVVGEEGDADGALDLTVQGTLGEGGMGRVDLGHQRALGRDVAIKRVRPDRFGGAAVDALLHEARITGALEHPSIIPVHLLGRDLEGRPLMVMKRVEGVSWRTLLREPEHRAWGEHREDRLGWNLEVLSRVCDAVHFAHARGVLHRDLKTENVMVGAFGEVYVLDWGIARRLEDPSPVTIAGTPGYMAPEALDEDSRPTVRADVYLLGSMLHEVLVGHTRHQGKSREELFAAARRSDPVAYPSTVPAELAALCNRATARDPAERPADALAFKAAVQDFLQHRGSVALTAEANARLEELSAAIRALAASATDDAGDARRASIRRLSGECVFGYRQALRVWGENGPAREGLRRCLSESVAFELDQRSATVAAMLLAELEGGDPALQARLTALQAQLQDEAQAREKLRRMEHDADAGVAVRQRSLVLIGSHVGSALFWLGLAKVGLEVTYRGIVGFATVLLLGIAGSFYVYRKSLMTNLYNRRFLASILAYCLFIIAQGLIGMLREVGVDLLAWNCYLGVSLAFGIMGVTLSRTMLAMIPPALVAAVLCVLYPHRVVESLAVWNLGAAVVWALLPRIQPASESPAPPA
ncbi:MAG: serine/threonine protein kinase [Deltaproteobacteria bacterium]|nr:serine/threonine protein kinase [Deltaproteobacteria bacterium]